MLADSTELLSCPACSSEGRFELRQIAVNEREVREGVLTCGECGHEVRVHDGVIELIHRPPEHVDREAAGLGRFAELMRRDGWDRAKVLQLPYIDDGYWFAQAAAMEAVLERFDFKPGERILDVGSNTCWASSTFGRLGMRVFALDITRTLMQGLDTAEWWMDEHDVHIERLLGSMFDIPLATGSMDYVFCCEVLHHNDSSELPRTFSEIARVLRPGGTLIVVNETLKTLLDRVGNHAEETGVAEYEGYEHAFWASQYLSAARAAGFEVEVVPPPFLQFFRVGAPARPGFKGWVKHRLKRSSLVRAAALKWVTYCSRATNLNFVATRTEK